MIYGIRGAMLKVAVTIFVASINYETIELLDIDFLISKVTFIFLCAIVLVFDPKLFSPLTRPKVFFPLFLFLLYYNAINYYNYQRVSIFWDDIDFTLNVVVLVLLTNIIARLGKGASRYVLDVYSYSSVALCLLALFGIGAYYYDGRLAMFKLNSNYLGFTCSLTCLFLVETYKNCGRPEKVFRILSIPLCFYVLILSGSRTGLLCAFAGYFVFLFKRAEVFKTISLGFISLLLVFPLIYFSLEDSLLLGRVSAGLSEDFEQGRAFIWSKVIILIRENWLFGIGSVRYADEISYYFSSTISPHNVFVEALVYTGAIGLCLLLLFFVRIYNCISFTKNNNRFELIGYMHIVVIALTAQLLGYKLAWILIACLIGAQPVQWKNSKK